MNRIKGELVIFAAKLRGLQTYFANYLAGFIGLPFKAAPELSLNTSEDRIQQLAWHSSRRNMGDEFRNNSTFCDAAQEIGMFFMSNYLRGCRARKRLTDFFTIRKENQK